MTQPLLYDRDSWHLRFHDLMPYRVREVLLVSSPYDAFILEEDGRLTERLFIDYSELNLSAAPRITHASTGARALDLLTKRRFDLVITMVRLADMDVTAFGESVKAYNPMMPVVLLAFTEAELSASPGGVDAVDLVFLWTGDSRILLAIIKLVEDRMNAGYDTRKAGVRVIIVVEDSIRQYSSFLSLLYAEMMSQSQSLIAEGLNDLHKLMRMRARPKILLARTFEEALTYYRRYREFLFAVISDVRFPRKGLADPEAGFKLVSLIKRENPDIPILLQSAEQKNAAQAEEIGVQFVNKHSERLLREIRWFLKEGLGFGDFIFRLPDRTEVGRARDMYEMEQVLRTVPVHSLEYHASRNHFSMWLMARSMLQLAQEIRPREITDFKDIEEMRKHLLGVLRKARRHEQEGVITDFSYRQTSPESQFVRLGSGSIGGKARGLAFANSLMARHHLESRFEGLKISIPKTVVVGTDAFDLFLAGNPQLEGSEDLEDDREIVRRFLDARLSDDIRRDLAVACQDLRGPLAVRSSSLLEDSHFQPFAGIYATYMLPNNHPDGTVRLKELWRAIKAVYASTYCQNARSYVSGTPYRVEEEKMGVIIQEMVGGRYGTRFYPSISGVGLSYNYYPIGYQKADEGIVLVALGLGQTIVLGGSVLQFSPSTPGILPQFAAARDFVRYSQSSFYALDMSRTTVDYIAGTESSLVQCDLDVAEQDGTLALCGSVYVQEEDRIRDTLEREGPRVVTFNNVLRWGAIPLAPALAEVLRIIRQGIGCPVEIEFAVDVGDKGPQGKTGAGARPPCLYVLQIRPQVQQLFQGQIDPGVFSAEEEALCRTDRALGHGVLDHIRDIVYVRRRDLDATTTPAVAEEVDRINASLRAEGAQYMLIGPGRWGTSDARLGVPVKWGQIAGAKVMVETAFNNRVVEPSQGTHFFHNITTFRVGYLTLDGQGHGKASYFDRAWLDAQPAHVETEHVRHVRLERPLRIYLDGQNGRAAVLKPAPEEEPAG